MAKVFCAEFNSRILFFFIFFFFAVPRGLSVEMWDISYPPGTEPGPSALVRAPVLTTGLAENSPTVDFNTVC